MQKVLYAIRHALPVLFLGYAVFINAQIFMGPDGLGGPIEGDVVTGGRAASLNGLYSAALPHRATAISLVGAGRYMLMGEGRAGVTVGENGWLFTDEEMTAADTDQLDLAIAEIAKTRDRLARLGTDLVVVPIPAKIDIYRDEGPRAAGQVMQAQYEAFRAALSDRNIPSVDTRPALIDTRAGSPVFLTSDTHWTPEGARRVARRIAESGLVPKGDTRFEKMPARPEEFVGDLVSFVTSDSIAPSIGLGPERVTPYVAEDPDEALGGIFATGSDKIDAVLVGTSYSANTDWSFVPALKIALKRDILNLSKEGQGPVAPMHDFLADPQLVQPAPLVVIWEYPVRYLGASGASATKDKEALNG